MSEATLDYVQATETRRPRQRKPLTEPMAIGQIGTILEKLTPGGRRRVINYFRDREVFDAEVGQVASAKPYTENT